MEFKDRFACRESLRQDPSIKEPTPLMKFEAEIGLPIRQIPLNTLMRKLESTAIPAEMILLKAADTVIRGAEDAAIYTEIARIVEMTADKEQQPLISYTEFLPAKPSLHGNKPRKAGGRFGVVELDCSLGNGMKRVEVDIPKWIIKNKKFDVIEEALEAAGRATTFQLEQEIMAKYEADVNTDAPSMTDTVTNWGGSATGHYKALTKMLSLIAKNARTPADVVIVNADEIYDILSSDYFIHSNYRDLAGRQQLEWARNLLGYLFPNAGIPIYWSNAATAAKMTMAARTKAMVCGIYTPLTVDHFNDVIKGEEGGVIEIQYDIKSGKDAKLSTAFLKTWAVATGA